MSAISRTSARNWEVRLLDVTHLTEVEFGYPFCYSDSVRTRALSNDTTERKPDMKFQKLATLLFGAALAGTATVASAVDKDAVQAEREARLEKIRMTEESAPLSFSQAQEEQQSMTHKLAFHSSHYSHSSHRSHSSHYSHRSGY